MKENTNAAPVFPVWNVSIKTKTENKTSTADKNAEENTVGRSVYTVLSSFSFIINIHGVMKKTADVIIRTPKAVFITESDAKCPRAESYSEKRRYMRRAAAAIANRIERMSDTE